MADILFTNLALLDPVAGKLRSGFQVLVSGSTIARVEKGRIAAKGARLIDCGGRTLMPGLIDCHNHISCPPSGLVGPPKILPSLLTAIASEHLRNMLMRGFTTVRDACGADLGHKQAVERGYFPGPRLFVAGRALSQTGGHGDARDRSELTNGCACGPLLNVMGRIADGVTEVRRAVREEIRLGADQIKVMAGGGVGSAADPVDQLQYSMEELEAIVDEATRSQTYVMAHAYSDAAIRRCVQAGVRTIDHGNFLGPETARMMAKAGTYLVPSLIVYRAIAEYGRTDVGYGRDGQGWPEDLLKKAAYVLSVGTRSLEVAKAAGVKMAYGTDLGPVHPELQADEFLVRAEVLTPAEIIRSATVIGAEVVRLPGKLGVIAPGALADLLVIDGNPFDDLKLFLGQGQHL
ncbi:MAG: amidohydrolase family protein [Rhodospirillales bacterium]|nr:amidohydrolase family protein [Rhodospirillales bacterium]